MKLTARYKGLAWLVLVVLILPLLAWRYALNGTTDQWLSARKNRRQTELLCGAANRPIDPRTALTTSEEMLLSGSLIAAVLPSAESEKLSIGHFSPCVTSDQDGVLLATGQMSLEGGFAGMVRVINMMEREIPQCKIISAQFHSVKPRGRGAVKTLNCTIYIQQITAEN